MAKTYPEELRTRLSWLLVPVVLVAAHSAYVLIATADDGTLHRSLEYVHPLLVRFATAIDVGGGGFRDIMLVCGGGTWLVLSAAWPVARLYRFLSAPAHLCPRCRYSLQGTRGGGAKHCPECGLVRP